MGSVRGRRRMDSVRGSRRMDSVRGRRRMGSVRKEADSVRRDSTFPSFLMPVSLSCVCTSGPWWLTPCSWGSASRPRPPALPRSFRR